MSSEKFEGSERAMTAVQLQKLADDRFKFTLLAGDEGLDNQIDSPRVQKLGLALSGYTDYLHSGRVQLVGRTEISFLKTMAPEDRRKAIARIFSRPLACILVTTGLQPPNSLVTHCRKNKVPLFQTQETSSAILSELTSLMEEELASIATVHGVLLEVFGLGVYLMGPSGIGKSECALDLILRGHRLVSDDLVVIQRLRSGRILGSGPSDLQFHMELRGLGIINIKELFGVSALSPRKIIDLTVDLVKWEAETEYDRLGLDERQFSMLDVAIPLITMPVAPGRNLATLVEVSVRIQMLKNRGYHPSKEFVRQLDARLKGSPDSSDRSWRL